VCVCVCVCVCAWVRVRTYVCECTDLPCRLLKFCHLFPLSPPQVNHFFFFSLSLTPSLSLFLSLLPFLLPFFFLPSSVSLFLPQSNSHPPSLPPIPLSLFRF